MSELHALTIHKARQLLDNGEISSRELTQAVLDRIKCVEPKVRAFITLTSELALQQAASADLRLQSKEGHDALTGIPLALKDNLCTRGVLTTCASRILRNFVPPYDAHVVEQLKQRHSVFVGKTNLDEFAMGSSTENSGFFVTRNPWNLDCVPGGSSGGSAAAVAADMCLAALGSDTGGSIRQPAGLCGVVGMKPTYGRVSRSGLVAYASSLDQIGPITKDVTDCALLMNAICGKDPRDSTSVDLPVPNFTAALIPDVKGLRIGVPKEFFAQGVATEVAEAIYTAVRLLEGQGAIVEETSLPTVEYGLACYYILAPAEASSNLARYDGVKYGWRTQELAGHVGMVEKTRGEGFGAEVKQRIMIGTYALSAGYYDAYYLKAQQVRTLIRRDFNRAFEQYDVLVTPVSPTVAFRIGEKADDPLAMKLADVCTIPVNIAGLPALSLPCGFQDGLPIGMQIIGKPWDEETILRIAYTFEQATDWHRRKPTL